MTRIRKLLRLFLSALVLAAPSSAFAADGSCDLCKTKATTHAIAGAHGDLHICDTCAVKHVSTDATTIAIVRDAKARLSAVKVIK